ncbi:hypothetical protein B296_00039487 [Ensete ventricosum]|uniref:Uncharacterized protein n=1 Tax=Ensete ventricosum TaxID=4639 RepID=A0A426YAC7_ENSVE|nr:hypothetical protein B296_00039487 [Ensete ventricosum]
MPASHCHHHCFLLPSSPSVSRQSSLLVADTDSCNHATAGRHCFPQLLTKGPRRDHGVRRTSPMPSSFTPASAQQATVGRFPRQHRFLPNPLLLSETMLLASPSSSAPYGVAQSHYDIILAAITILATSCSALYHATSRISFPSDRSSHVALSSAAQR